MYLATEKPSAIFSRPYENPPLEGDFLLYNSNMQYECPRCRSLQKFTQLTEPAGEGKSRILMKCKICQWKYVVIVGSDDIIKAYKDVERLKKKVKKVPSLRFHLERRKKQLNELLRQEADT